ncbi:BZ3500_MvSof-1268-A1-R1_Chr7-1g09082 [Microbotryum saponariae]|uniref:BZ3500_MvSof-1268-A1-R1_Chr7-1g09082 protein n=1 Tax=Microbotryum saponariae TaxID=289078 RepID=A0A2X0KW49_9BASI|nr:BZ3501_MvSof-1269-A2-R1_Chr7-1g08786 [Microbotryum saponariae]SDA02763.1 BZ3500_MvSof-1268-A1-R1_Chr7-1g09082 [Microbotryum saponariae]
MDTISDADYYVISLFQNGSYRSALSAYSELPSASTLPTLYAARAHLALSPPSPSDALSLLSSLERTLDTRALTALANFLSGDHERAIEELEEVQIELGEGGLEEQEEGRFVRGVLATVWWLSGEEGRREEAVEMLYEAVQLGADQECLGILTHLYQSLSLPQRSLALLTSPQTTSFTSDSLQSQLFTARTNLSLGPKQRYEQAYYVYEEIKGLHGGRGESTLAGVAVSQACLGRWDEAVQAILEGLEMNPSHPTLLANFIALARYYTPNAQDSEALTVEKALASLQALEPTHPFVVELKNKSDAFDEAAGKFGKAAQ